MTRRRADRAHYKPDMGEKVGRIEKRRKGLKVSVSELARRGQMTERTLHRIRKTGRAWPRQIRALAMALRSLERENRTLDGLFPGETDPGPKG